ncbi:MAG: DUF1501 domain-containing protein [Planctomycetia bacterium]|nr:DUF1501 domain-containing protein [Planctomycetia bacterium]
MPQASQPSRGFRNVFTRREALSRAALGMGSMALAALLGEEGLLGRFAAAAGHVTPNDTLPRPPHFAARAKRVVLLFQHGGPSHVDLFDPKPALEKYSGQPVPGGVEAFFDKQDSGKCMPSPFKFARHGQCGMHFSELLPQLATCADSICQIRSMHTDFNDHEGAIRLFQTGKGRAGRPTLGAWVTYGLGTDNQNLPAYVVLSDPNGDQVDGSKNWSSGWLPALYQGTPLRARGTPLFNLAVPRGINRQMRDAELELLSALNQEHRQQYPHLSELEARIKNYELAAAIQTSVTEALDTSRESAETQKLYGMDREVTAPYGTRCLMARRLLERGVRFVSVFNDLILGDPWDTHFDHNKRTRQVAENVDRPSAAIIQDLKRRGMLDDTLVIWAGEFGRLPVVQGKDGRDHNRYGFTILLAGGGAVPGLTFGATDDFGYKAVDNPVAVVDLQATLLRLLGLDHEGLAFLHLGRDETMTDAAVTGARIVAPLLGSS